MASTLRSFVRCCCRERSYIESFGGCAGAGRERRDAEVFDIRLVSEVAVVAVVAAAMEDDPAGARCLVCL